MHQRITVRDTGIGISREDQGRLFNKFTQLDTTTGRRTGGTGLGLCIARQYVEMHGGRIELARRADKGKRIPDRLAVGAVDRGSNAASPFSSRCRSKTPARCRCCTASSFFASTTTPIFSRSSGLRWRKAGYEVLLATDPPPRSSWLA